MKKIKAILSLLLFSMVLIAGDSSLEIYGWASPWTSLPTEQQIAKLTHLICYPIYPLKQKAEVYTSFNKSDLHSLVSMAHRNGVKVLLSLGRDSLDIGQKMEASTAYQDSIVSSMMDIMDEFDADGLDNAWEPPYYYWKPADEGIKYAEMCAMRRVWNGFNSAIRDSITSRYGSSGKEFTITVSGQNQLWFQTPEYAADNKVYPDGFWKYSDRILLMNYNDGLGKYHSTYSQMITDINTWAGRGMPKNKIVPGFLFRGQGLWSNDTLNTGQVIESTLSYATIMSDHPNLPLDQDTVVYEFYHTKIDTIDEEEVEVPDTTRVTYGFNSVMTIRKKLDYIFDNNLPGSMFWQIGSDVSLSSEKSLIAEIAGDGTGSSAVIESSAYSSLQKSVIRIQNEKLTFTVEPEQFQILSHSGRTIYEGNGSSHFSTRSLSSGIYICRMQGLSGLKSITSFRVMR